MNARNPKKIFSNSRSSASAGSGKTYKLTGRYIALALESDDPASIVALTFTRKSAGEFTGEILRRLAEASVSDKAAAELSAAVSGDEKTYSRADFYALLKKLAENLGRLRLGTIDSFCASLLGVFASDFGLFAPISVMDSFSEAAEISAVRERVFRKSAVSDQAFEDFRTLLRKATFGQEEKSLTRNFTLLIDSARRLLWLHPDLEKWGDGQSAGGIGAGDWDADKYSALLGRLSNAEEAAGLEKFGISKFFSQSDNLKLARTPVAVEALSEAYRELGYVPDDFKIVSRKKEFPVSPELARAASAMFDMILRTHVSRLRIATRSLGEICAAFEREYSRTVRSRGKLVFDDIPKILASPEYRITTLLMEERLDSKIKHWLFDEFQDTSRLQWGVFENLIEEAVFDDSRERSFFYVGDVKQSIYSWRGGDFRLFGEIFDKYSRAGLMNEGERLVKSWRSGVEVIKLVNAFFADTAALGEAFSEKSAEIFGGLFAPHESARPEKKSLISLTLTPNGKDLEEETRAVWEGVYEILKRTNPPKHGKSCAVLLRKNSDVAGIVDYVRRRSAEDGAELSIAAELESGICEGNMVVPPFAQIVKALAHPTDTLAVAAVEMTPLKNFCRNFDADFRREMLEKIESGGYSALFDEYSRFLKSPELSGIGRLDAFSEQMLSMLGDACAEFDKTVFGGADAFDAFLRSKKFRSGTAENTVQVMTIHKSKGLGFDMVVLPDIYKSPNKGGLGKVSEMYGGGFGDEGDFAGILITPLKDVCALDKFLYENYNRLQDTSAFENICALYVALTRAKNALYVVMPEPKPKSKSAMPSLISGAFEAAIGANVCESDGSGDGVGEICAGFENWFEGSAEELPERGEIPPLESPAAFVPSGGAARASESENFDVEAAEFGTAVHALLAEYSRSGVLPARESAADFASPEVFGVVRRLGKSEAGRKVFGFGGEVYTEIPFFGTFGGVRENGVIDRLEIERNPDSSVREARVIDFKPTAANPEQYASQLAVYARNVRRLFAAENVRAFILGYSDCRLVELDLKDF